MIITQIYNEFKNNLPAEQFELKWNGGSFDIYFKKYDNRLQILVCEEWCIPYIPNKGVAVHYGSKNIKVIMQRIFDVIAFMKQFAEYMERYVIDNTPKYGLVKLIQGEE